MMPSAFPTVCWKVIQYFRNEGYFPLERCPKLCRAWKNVAARHVASLSHGASTFVYNTARVARVRLRQLRVVLVRRCCCRRHHRHYNCVVSSRLSDETASWSHTQRRCCIALAHALQTPCGVVSGVRRMNQVNARRARLVLGWVIVFGRVYHLGM